MRARSLHAVTLGVAVAIFAIATPAPRVAGAAVSGCSKTSGVTVIVDFTYFQRDIERGCAPGTPATALAAVQAAGFSTAGTTQYGDAFLCRIDNLPPPKDEACAATPPARSSWSFYWARATDAAWTYSPTGVLSYRPPAGTIVAFAFGDLAKPGLLPSAAIRTSTSSPPTATTTPPTRATAPAGRAAGRDHDDLAERRHADHPCDRDSIIGDDIVDTWVVDGHEHVARRCVDADERAAEGR